MSRAHCILFGGMNYTCCFHFPQYIFFFFRFEVSTAHVPSFHSFFYVFLSYFPKKSNYSRATKKLFVECESYTLVKMAATFCNFESNSFKLFIELGLLLLLSSLGLLLRFGLALAYDFICIAGLLVFHTVVDTLFVSHFIILS